MYTNLKNADIQFKEHLSIVPQRSLEMHADVIAGRRIHQKWN